MRRALAAPCRPSPRASPRALPSSHASLYTSLGAPPVPPPPRLVSRRETCARVAHLRNAGGQRSSLGRRATPAARTRARARMCWWSERTHHTACVARARSLTLHPTSSPSPLPACRMPFSLPRRCWASPRPRYAHGARPARAPASPPPVRRYAAVVCPRAAQVRRRVQLHGIRQLVGRVLRLADLGQPRPGGVQLQLYSRSRVKLEWVILLLST